MHWEPHKHLDLSIIGTLTTRVETEVAMGRQNVEKQVIERRCDCVGRDVGKMGERRLGFKASKGVGGGLRRGSKLQWT